MEKISLTFHIQRHTTHLELLDEGATWKRSFDFLLPFLSVLEFNCKDVRKIANDDDDDDEILTFSNKLRR